MPFLEISKITLNPFYIEHNILIQNLIKFIQNMKKK